MSVNYGLDFLDLPEWSLYYAQKALFCGSVQKPSHIGVAKAYLKLGEVKCAAGVQRVCEPVLQRVAAGADAERELAELSNRYDTLISKPGHYVTVGGAVRME